MKITKKDFTKKVQSKLIEKEIIPDCPLEGADAIISTVFDTLIEELQQPTVDVFMAYDIKIKKSILPPRNLVNLRDTTKLIAVPEKARYYLKILKQK